MDLNRLLKDNLLETDLNDLRKEMRRIRRKIEIEKTVTRRERQWIRDAVVLTNAYIKRQERLRLRVV